MIIKVCGMREPGNIRAVEEAGADWMGLIFFPRSPRYVPAQPAYLPVQSRRVGVFVNAQADTVLHTADAFGLDYLQLHGNEMPEACHTLRAAGYGIIKAFSVKEEADLLTTTRYEGCCDYYLFDTACPGYGGSGKTFDWQLLDCYTGQTPFLLSGGLSPASTDALLAFHHPAWAGIDLNSGFESAPGVKDLERLRPFIASIKNKELKSKQP